MPLNLSRGRRLSFATRGVERGVARVAIVIPKNVCTLLFYRHFFSIFDRAVSCLFNFKLLVNSTDVRVRAVIPNTAISHLGGDSISLEGENHIFQNRKRLSSKGAI